METKLYVGNLSYETTEDQLRELFGQSGVVSTVDLIKDRDTGSSKGFAFVMMNSKEEADKAIQDINGKMVGNRELRVSVARPREERSGYDNNRSQGYRSNSNRGNSGGRRY